MKESTKEKLGLAALAVAVVLCTLLASFRVDASPNGVAERISASPDPVTPGAVLTIRYDFDAAPHPIIKRYDRMLWMTV